MTPCAYNTCYKAIISKTVLTYNVSIGLKKLVEKCPFLRKMKH